MLNPRFSILGAVIAISLMAGAARASTLFYTLASACGPDSTCSYSPTQVTSIGGTAVGASISRGYTYVPSAGGDGGYNVGVNSSITYEAPMTWHAFSQTGGFFDIPGPMALSAMSARTNAGAVMSETLTALPTPTWSGAGVLRFSLQVEGAVSVSYSAPGTPEQASAGVSLNFECSKSVFLGSAFSTIPCASPDFAPAPVGAYTLVAHKTFNGSQTFSDTLDFDVPVQSGQEFIFGFSSGLGSSMGYAAGTPVGALSALAVGDFLNTGRLVGVTLFDGSGNVVSDAQLQAESGFDYLGVSVVPAPPALALLLTALAPLVVRARSAISEA